MVDQPLLKDLPCEKNYPVAHLLRVSNFELKKTKKGDDYLLFRVSDATKSVTCKRWKSTPSDLDRFKDCKALFITGKVDPYNNELSIVAESLAEPEEEAAEKFLMENPLSKGKDTANSGEPMKQPLLKDLKEKDIPITGLYRVFGAELKPAKSGKPFLSFRAGDKSGEVSCKKWGCGPEDLRNIKNMKVANLIGDTDDYGNSISIIVTSIEPSNASESEIKELHQPAKYDVDLLKKEIWGIIKKMEDPYIRDLSLEILKDKLAKELSTAYASVSGGHHHGYRSGLIIHIARLLKIGIPFVDAINANMYPNSRLKVNKDAVIFGLIFHDFWKTMETPEGVYTAKASLNGHLTMGAIQINRKMDKIEGFPETTRDALTHILLAHHGQFGPQNGMNCEAVIVHYLDVCFSRLDPILEALDDLPEGQEFTEQLKVLKNPAWLGVTLRENVGCEEKSQSLSEEN